MRPAPPPLPAAFLAAVLATGLAGIASAQRPAATGPLPLSRHADWTPQPGPWEPAGSAIVDDASGVRWRLAVGRRPLGSLKASRAEVPVYLPRVELQRIDGADTSTVAVLLPTGNRDDALFPPHSPEEAAAPTVLTEDPEGRWPNACSYSILDASGRLDLNDDGAVEVAISRFCSCPATSCSGIDLIELAAAGPRLLDPAALVRKLHLGRVRVMDMRASADPARPILDVAPELLDDCRIVAMAGVRGYAEGGSTCGFPVALRPTFGGAYEPYFDPTYQQPSLKRAEDDLGYVAAGSLADPLRAEEEARIVRAAAFFYLTGSTTQTRAKIAAALGERARDFHVQELLDRLDKVMLADTTALR